VADPGDKGAMTPKQKKNSAIYQASEMGQIGSMLPPPPNEKWGQNLTCICREGSCDDGNAKK